MSPLSTVAVTIVAMVLPIADLFELRALADGPPAISRPQSHTVAAAEVEVDAGADDIDEHPHDRGWQAGGALLTFDLESARCGFLHMPPGSDVRAGGASAASIRGPPSLG